MARSGKFFSESELSCHCCGGFPDENGVDDRLVAALDNMREMMGGPLEISCAYRCPEHNAYVGGVHDSDHVRGEAADILVPSFLSFEQLEWYVYHNGIIDPNELAIGTYKNSGFIHFGIRGYPARWDESDY